MIRECLNGFTTYFSFNIGSTVSSLAVVLFSFAISCQACQPDENEFWSILSMSKSKIQAQMTLIQEKASCCLCSVVNSYKRSFVLNRSCITHIPTYVIGRQPLLIWLQFIPKSGQGLITRGANEKPSLTSKSTLSTGRLGLELQRRFICAITAL
jgi:hypothetical protein